jgi:predicted Fe-S protein YdhL (DUF1289 family)
MDEKKTGTKPPGAPKVRYTPQQRAQARRSYGEIGQSIACMILEGNQSEDWAWQLVGDLGLYERWELDLWLQMHRRERRSVLKAQEERLKRKQELDRQLQACKPRRLLKALHKKGNGRNSQSRGSRNQGSR